MITLLVGPDDELVLLGLCLNLHEMSPLDLALAVRVHPVGVDGGVEEVATHTGDLLPAVVTVALPASGKALFEKKSNQIRVFISIFF